MLMKAPKRTGLGQKVMLRVYGVVFLLVMAAVTVYTFTAAPIFEARTRLLIESDNQNVVSFKEVVDEDQTKADYYQTQYNILQSRALARKTLDSLKLWDHPLFNADKITAPLLVLQGANDPRVLKVESDEIVAAVKKKGIPVEYVVFDDEAEDIAVAEQRSGEPKSASSRPRSERSRTRER